MFDILETFTQFCGGEAKATPPPESAPEAAAVADPKKEVVKEVVDNSTEHAKSSFNPTVDPMDASNYLVAHLTRPMGILFEENIDDVHLFGGAIIADVKEGCSAAADRSICRGDQLVAIGTKRVSGMDFDEVMEIIAGSGRKINLTVFRGPAESLYGPLASVDWLDAFVAERGEVAALYDGQVDSFAFPDDTAEVSARKNLFNVAPLADAVVDGDAICEAVKADLFGAATAVHDAVGEKNHNNTTLGIGDVEALKPSAVEEVEVPVVENEGEADERNDVDAYAVLGVDTKEDGLEEESDAVEEVLTIDEGIESAVEDVSEADLEKKTEASSEAVPSDNEDWLNSHNENTASQTISNALADVMRGEVSNNGKNILEENLPVWEESEIREAGPGPADITESFDTKKDADGTDAVVVEDEANIVEDVAGEATSEAETPMPHGSVTNASKIEDLLDYHDTNGNTALISDDESDGLSFD